MNRPNRDLQSSGLGGANQSDKALAGLIGLILWPQLAPCFSQSPDDTKVVNNCNSIKSLVTKNRKHTCGTSFVLYYCYLGVKLPQNNQPENSTDQCYKEIYRNAYFNNELYERRISRYLTFNRRISCTEMKQENNTRQLPPRPSPPPPPPPRYINAFI